MVEGELVQLTNKRNARATNGAGTPKVSLFLKVGA
jgi:hypothetical protein